MHTLRVPIFLDYGTVHVGHILRPGKCLDPMPHHDCDLALGGPVIDAT